MLPAATKSKYGKNLKSYILTPSTPGAGDVNEVWGTHKWSYSPHLATVSPPNFKYATLWAGRN